MFSTCRKTTDGREEVQQQTTPVRPVTEHHLRILLPNTAAKRMQDSPKT